MSGPNCPEGGEVVTVFNTDGSMGDGASVRDGHRHNNVPHARSSCKGVSQAANTASSTRVAPATRSREAQSRSC
jgi:hypothetical protein